MQKKFTEPIDKSEPLWFLHQVFAGKIKFTEEQGNVVDAAECDTHCRNEFLYLILDSTSEVKDD